MDSMSVGTMSTLSGRRRKGKQTEREKADRLAYLLLSRYGTRKPAGKEVDDLIKRYYWTLKPEGSDRQVQYNEVLKRFLEEGRVAELFEIWKEQLKMVYKDAEEKKKRFEAFERTLKFVVNSNPESGYCLGLNCLAAELPEELERRLAPNFDIIYDEEAQEWRPSMIPQPNELPKRRLEEEFIELNIEQPRPGP